MLASATQMKLSLSPAQMLYLEYNLRNCSVKDKDVLGQTELLIILLIVLILFGGSRIGRLGGEMGQAISNFRKGMREAEALDEETPDKDES